MNELDTSCSDASLRAGEQLAGSAPHAVAWVALEQSGPWGPKAFTDSHLDPLLGRTVEDLCVAHGIRPSLVRTPGRHADRHTAEQRADPRRLLVAYTHPARPWLLEGTLDRPGDVLGLDWAAVGTGDIEAARRSLPVLSRSENAHLLVCTNGTRDVCCATKGRPVALSAYAAFPDRVWEVTHTSGHRFAPTTVLLPWGVLHGRLDRDTAKGLVTAADRGETVLAGSRGRSTWPMPGQVAELAVRELTAEIRMDALAVMRQEQRTEQSWVVEVVHVDGRRWRVVVESRASDVHRAESCGKALMPMTWLTRSVEPTG